VAREIKKKVVSSCPVCSGELSIGRLACGECKTSIETALPIPAYFRLPEDLQEFVMVFLRCRGNIRDVEKVLGISYPTVCKRLDLVNALLGNTPPLPAAGPGGGASAAEVLERLERGEISAKEAAQLLKGRT
jgi:hypothetical protein